MQQNRWVLATSLVFIFTMVGGCANKQPFYYSRMPIKKLTRKAEAGDAQAQYALGTKYNWGRSSGHNSKNATKWFRRAAEQGHTEAQFHLGVAYERGRGVGKNLVTARSWYVKAARDEHIPSQAALSTNTSPQEVLQAHQMILDEDGLNSEKAEDDLKTQLSLARYYKINAISEKAITWYTKAAEQGLVEAQLELAEFYSDTPGNFKNMHAAINWYRKAAENENADAQAELGMIYHYGIGVQKDKAEAKKWYARSSKQGSKLAQTKLCQMNPKCAGKMIKTQQAPKLVVALQIFQASLEPVVFSFAYMLAGSYRPRYGYFHTRP